MRNLFFICVTIGLLLSGCASQYKPNSLINGGYSDTMLAKDTFLVSFRGNDVTSPERTRDFAMLRSAELVLSKGYPFFVILDMGTQSQSYNLPATSSTATTMSYGNYTHTTYNPGYSSTVTNFYSNLKVKGFTADSAPSNALSAQEVMKDTKAIYTSP